jgi:hypothetical protein
MCALCMQEPRAFGVGLACGVSPRTGARSTSLEHLPCDASHTRRRKMASTGHIPRSHFTVPLANSPVAPPLSTGPARLLCWDRSRRHPPPHAGLSAVDPSPFLGPPAAACTLTTPRCPSSARTLSLPTCIRPSPPHCGRPSTSAPHEDPPPARPQLFRAHRRRSMGTEPGQSMSIHNADPGAG